MITLKEVADKIYGKLIGDKSIPISSVDDIVLASKESISFAFLPKYKKAIAESKASAFIVTSEVDLGNKAGIIVDNPYLSMSKVLDIFDQMPVPSFEVSENSIVLDSVNIKEESGAEIETSNLTINQSNGLKLYQSNEKTLYRSLDNKVTTKSGVIIDMEKNLTNLLGKVEILKSSGTKIFTSDLIIDKSNSKEIYRTKQLSNYVSIKSNIKANQMYYDVLSEKIDLSGGVVAIYD